MLYYDLNVKEKRQEKKMITCSKMGFEIQTGQLQLRQFAFLSCAAIILSTEIEVYENRIQNVV